MQVAPVLACPVLVTQLRGLIVEPSVLSHLDPPVKAVHNVGLPLGPPGLVAGSESEVGVQGPQEGRESG